MTVYSEVEQGPLGVGFEGMASNLLFIVSKREAGRSIFAKLIILPIHFKCSIITLMRVALF